MKSYRLPAIFFLLSMFSITALRSHIVKSSKRLPRFISFDTKDGKINVDLEFTIPFISIPLDHDNSDGPKPLVNVNLKSITAAGVMAAIAVFVVPLLINSPHDHRYRLDDDFGFWDAGQTINELALGNNYVTPCVKRAVCSAIAKANGAKNPSGIDKIIDGISTLGWFEHVTNGTMIQEAIKVGRQSNSHCSLMYEGCAMSAELLQMMMDELGSH